MQAVFISSMLTIQGNQTLIFGKKIWDKDLGHHPVCYSWLWRFILQETCDCVPECVLYSLAWEKEGVGSHAAVSYENIKFK